MSNDAYLGELGIQLLVAPESSFQLMKGVAAGAPPPSPPGAFDVAIDARSWCAGLFRDDWRFNEQAPPLMIPIAAEDGKFDVMRFSYMRGPVTIEVAQSRHVIAVRLRGLEVDRRASVERQAETVAKLVLDVTPPVVFAPASRVGTGFFSKRAPMPTTKDRRRHSSSLEQELRFWTDGVDVGFVSLKDPGHETQELIAPGTDVNETWFVHFAPRR